MLLSEKEKILKEKSITNELSKIPLSPEEAETLAQQREKFRTNMEILNRIYPIKSELERTLRYA